MRTIAKSLSSKTVINRFVLSIRKLFILILLFTINPLEGNPFTAIDLNKLDVYIRQGFSNNWNMANPTENTDWIKIPKSETGNRSLSIRKLNLPFIQSRQFFDFQSRPAESFTFLFEFDIDENQLSTSEGIGLGLIGIAYNWEIYLNGVLIDEFNKGIKNGSLIQPKRGKRHIVPFSNDLLVLGKNYLCIRTIGSPDFLGTGMYYANPYSIDSIQNLNKLPLRLYQYSIVWIYGIIGIFWFYMYRRIPSFSHYLYFMGWALTIAGYNLARIDYLTPLSEWGLFTFRLEYFSIYISSFCFMGFIQHLFYGKLSKPSKVFMVYFGVSGLLSWVLDVGLMNDLFRVWQSTILLPMGLLIWQSTLELIKLVKSRNKDEPIWALFYKTSLGSLFLGVLVLFIFLGMDIFTSLFRFEFTHFNLLGFLFFTLIVSVISFADFIEYYIEATDLKENLEIEVKKRTQEIRHLSNAILFAQETERKKLSQDLHDEIGQALTVINLNLQAITQNSTFDIVEIHKQINLIQTILNETADTIRQFSFNLRPSILDDIGLIPAMKAHAKQFSERTKIKVNFSSSVNGINDETVKIVLYRVFQESLTNVAKHSQSDTVSVVVENSNHWAELTVLDYGIGIEREQFSQQEGLGLLGMKERVEGIGGSFSYQSFPGEGVSIHAKVPLTLK